MLFDLTSFCWAFNWVHSQRQRCGIRNFTQFDYQRYAGPLTFPTFARFVLRIRTAASGPAKTTRKCSLCLDKQVVIASYQEHAEHFAATSHQQPHLLKVRMQNALAACQGNSSNFTLQTLVSFCDMATAKRKDQEPSRVPKKTQIHTNPAIVQILNFHTARLRGKRRPGLHSLLNNLEKLQLQWTLLSFSPSLNVNQKLAPPQFRAHR